MAANRAGHIKRNGQSFGKQAPTPEWARAQGYAAGRLIYNQQRPVVKFKKARCELLRVPAEDVEYVVDTLLDRNNIALRGEKFFWFTKRS